MRQRKGRGTNQGIVVDALGEVVIVSLPRNPL